MKFIDNVLFLHTKKRQGETQIDMGAGMPRTSRSTYYDSSSGQGQRLRYPGRRQKSKVKKGVIERAKKMITG